MSSADFSLAFVDCLQSACHCSNCLWDLSG